MRWRQPCAALISSAAADSCGRSPSSRSAVRRAVGPEIVERGVDDAGAVADRHGAGRQALLALPEGHGPPRRADVRELRGQLVDRRRPRASAAPSRRGEAPAPASPDRRRRGAACPTPRRERQWLADLGEVAELEVARRRPRRRRADRADARTGARSRRSRHAAGPSPASRSARCRLRRSRPRPSAPAAARARSSPYRPGTAGRAAPAPTAAGGSMNAAARAAARSSQRGGSPEPPPRRRG